VEIRQQTEFIVPTGNFGNVLAGWLLKKMGVPLFHFTVATNQNDILHRFFQTGEYAQGSVKPSLAPSMDIQAASNFERFLYYWKKENPAEVLSILHAIKNKTSSQLDKPEDVFISSTCTDDVEIQQWIKKIEEQYQYIVDPHTACGFNQSPCHPAAKARVILSTAHPAKFPEVIHQVLGIDVVHPSLECLKSKELTTYPLSANVEAVKTLMRQKLALL
jgi:threonine synthase